MLEVSFREIETMIRDAMYALLDNQVVRETCPAGVIPDEVGKPLAAFGARS